MKLLLYLMPDRVIFYSFAVSDKVFLAWVLAHNAVLINSQCAFLVEITISAVPGTNLKLIY